MVSEVAPAGTIAVSWPSRPISGKVPSQDAGGRAGHRPEVNALLTSGPMVPELVNSPLEAVTHWSGSSVAATHIVAAAGVASGR